jgi:hypothetical protein
MFSPFTNGLIIGVVAYWALQHFTGIGKTGKVGP